MHAVTITHLSRSPGLNFLPQDLLQSIYSHFMSTHLRTQPCASYHLDLHKKHSRWKHKHAKYSNTSFPPSSQGLWLVTCSTLTHSTGTNGCRSKAHSTRRGSELFRRWKGGGGGGGNKGRQLWGLALHAVSSPFGTIIIRIRLAVVTGGGHLLTLLT